MILRCSGGRRINHPLVYGLGETRFLTVAITSRGTKRALYRGVSKQRKEKREDPPAVHKNIGSESKRSPPSKQNGGNHEKADSERHRHIERDRHLVNRRVRRPDPKPQSE